MCWICDTDRSLVVQNYLSSLGVSHFQRPSSADAMLLAPTDDFSFSAGPKLTDAFPADGVGDFKPITTTSVLLLTPDAIANDTSTTTTITVDGPSIISTIDSIGDQDFVRVELVAGRIYDIGQYLVLDGPSGVPLSDAFIELYDASGNLLTSADGGGPNTPSGLDALLTFIPEVSGTYYINARALRPRCDQRHRRRRGRRLRVVRHRCHRPAELRALLRPRQPASLDRLGHAGRPHLAQPGWRGRSADHRQCLYRGRIESIRDRGQERHHRLLCQGRRRVRVRGSAQSRR